jgi:hypothetical protein
VTRSIISLGLVLAAASALAAELRTSDENGDGRPDHWFVIANGEVVEYRADTDFDGRVDALVKYAGGDRLAYEEYDYNLDGAMDDFYFYEGGKLKRREVDSNFDGKVDLRVYLKDGRYIEKLERDTDFDGTFDVVKDYTKTR